MKISNKYKIHKQDIYPRLEILKIKAKNLKFLKKQNNI
jgi:hypothetical protein